MTVGCRAPQSPDGVKLASIRRPNIGETMVNKCAGPCVGETLFVLQEANDTKLLTARCRVRGLLLLRHHACVVGF